MLWVIIDGGDRWGWLMVGMGHCREFRNIEHIAGRYGMLQNIMEVLRIVTEHYTSVMKRYGTVTENIDYDHLQLNFKILLITEMCAWLKRVDQNWK